MSVGKCRGEIAQIHFFNVAKGNFICTYLYELKNCIHIVYSVNACNLSKPGLPSIPP